MMYFLIRMDGEFGPPDVLLSMEGLENSELRNTLIEAYQNRHPEGQFLWAKQEDVDNAV